MYVWWMSCLCGLYLVPFGFSADECYMCTPGIDADGNLDFCAKPSENTSCSGDCLTVSYWVKSDQSELAGNIMMCGMGVCEAAGKKGCENVKNTQKKEFRSSNCQYKCCSGDLCNDKPLYDEDVPSTTPSVAAVGTAPGVFAKFLPTGPTLREMSPRSQKNRPTSFHGGDIPTPTPRGSGERGAAARFGTVLAALFLGSRLHLA